MQSTRPGAAVLLLAAGLTATAWSSAPNPTAEAITALQTAAGAVPNGQPFDLETETYQGQPVWDIKVASDGNEFHLYVSADGNSVVSQDQDDNPDDDIEKLQGTQLTAVDAVQQAIDQYGGELSEMEIDTENGTVVWQVDLDQPDGSSIEVNLDANTGDVVSTSGD